MRSAKSNTRALRGLIILLIALPCVASGPPAQQQPRAEPAQARPVAPRAAGMQSHNLPSSVLGGGGVQSKIKVTSTDAQGNCPNGGTKLDKCSGVYPNGNSWEISPCCRIEVN